MQRTVLRIVCVLFFSIITLTLVAQNKDTTQPSRGFLERLRAFGQDETKASIEKYRNGRIAARQDSLLAELQRTSQRARIFLKKGADTVGYANDVKLVTSELNIIRDGIFVNAGSYQNTRNLAVSAAVLNELLTRMVQRKNSLAKNISTMAGFVDRIDSISADSSLYTFPFDSLTTVNYIQKIAVLARDLGPADSALRKSITSLQHLATDLDLLLFNLRSNYEDIERLRREQEARLFEQEFAYIWDRPKHHRPFADILSMSAQKEMLALKYYVADYKGRILLLLTLILASWIFLRSLRQKWIDDKKVLPGLDKQLVLRYPILSAFILVCATFQFIFPQPPFIFEFVLWMAMAICLAVIFSGFIAHFWLRFWTISVLLFFLSGFSNLLLQASRPERWFLLLISAASAIYAAAIFINRKKNELKESAILYFIVFMGVMELFSSIANIAGRYNLAKSLMISGIAGLIIAILFLWTIRLINEGLRLVSSVYKHPDRKLFYIDFNKVGERAPKILYIFLVIGWIILVGRNFYAFHQLSQPVKDWLNADRTIGNYTFTINSLFVFIIIITISALISQIISFFTTDPVDTRNRQKAGPKAGVGSWLLLIRIFILSVGIFFAFAAAGIPVDRLTIILGALGVGIGLGLQGLVTNLVSGLIIAFEKPVNVGDVIEINGRLGTMKSIGFRSSSIDLINGGCLVIPNGDLLSNHLLNWTTGKNRQRLNLAVAVAYSSDLKKAKQILEDILRSNEQVISYPEPVVSARSFEDSAIVIDLFFWINNRDFFSARGEVLTAINEAFQAAGIVIPIPQQEIHIMSGENQRDAKDNNGAKNIDPQ